MMCKLIQYDMKLFFKCLVAEASVEILSYLSYLFGKGRLTFKDDLLTDDIEMTRRFSLNHISTLPIHRSSHKSTSFH